MRAHLCLGILVATISACAGTGAPAPGPAAALPAGQGREILERECLNCHELDALELFSGYYGRSRWRDLVLTMRDNGARVDNAQVDVLAAYLAEHFGTGGD